jgi:hypothetical protein
MQESKVELKYTEGNTTGMCLSKTTQQIYIVCMGVQDEKKPKKLQWDEQNLLEISRNRRESETSFFTEPKTPYHRDNSSDECKNKYNVCSDSKL